jgi:hypothetical protein
MLVARGWRELTIAGTARHGRWHSRQRLRRARGAGAGDDKGHTLQPSCFAALPTCGSLEEAAVLGAVLANNSAVTPIAACE